MVDAVAGYFSELSQQTGAAWNRFWFQRADPFRLCGMRILIGLLALWWYLSYAFQLTAWFGPRGLLRWQTVRTVTTAGTQPDGGLFANLQSTPALITLYLMGLVAIVCLTLGIYTRLAAVASLVFSLIWIHRAPMITGHFEPVLTMLMLYLCLAPAGAYLSCDRWWRRAAGPEGDEPQRSVWAHVALRLMQVHLCALYFMMGLTKLGGEPWWSGQAIWWLAGQSESRLIDLSLLYDHRLLVNAWTHLIVLVELAFPVLIWVRLARPLVIALSAIVWVSLIPVTGLVGFCLAMIAANFVFVSDETWRWWFGRRPMPATDSLTRNEAHERISIS